MTSPVSKPEEEQPFDFFPTREEDDNTASVNVVAPTPIPDNSIDSDQFHLSDEGLVIVTEKNDPHAMQAKAWW